MIGPERQLLPYHFLSVEKANERLRVAAPYPVDLLDPVADYARRLRDAIDAQVLADCLAALPALRADVAALERDG